MATKTARRRKPGATASPAPSGQWEDGFRAGVRQALSLLGEEYVLVPAGQASADALLRVGFRRVQDLAADPKRLAALIIEKARRPLSPKHRLLIETALPDLDASVRRWLARAPADAARLLDLIAKETLRNAHAQDKTRGRTEARVDVLTKKWAAIEPRLKKREMKVVAGELGWSVSTFKRVLGEANRRGLIGPGAESTANP